MNPELKARIEAGVYLAVTEQATMDDLTRCAILTAGSLDEAVLVIAGIRERLGLPTDVN